MVPFLLQLRHPVAAIRREALGIGKNLLRPRQFVVIGDYEQTFALIAGGLEAALREDIHALAAIMFASWRIGIEKIETAGNGSRTL